MPDVVVSDPGAGVIDIETLSNRTVVLGSNLYMDVLLGAQVTIKGTDLFLRLHVEWNGSTNAPTIISAFPTAFWSGLSLSMTYHGNLSVYEWMISWTHTATAPTFLPQVTQIVGTSCGLVENSSWAQYVDYDYYGIITKTAGGSGVLPTSGDQSMIIL